MDTKETFLRIAQNEQNYGQCDSDTAANLINNEESLNMPMTVYMYDPSQTNPNGSIQVSERRKLLETGAFDGAGQTLADSRLYSFYKPYEQELFEKEKELKKAIFDDQGFLAQFGNNYMYNKYSLERSASVYKMAEARKVGDMNTVMDEQYKIASLDEKLKQYIQPSEGFKNSTANLLASMARNAPETLAVSLGAGAIAAMSGGIAIPFLATAGSTVLNGAIIYNDTFDIEAGEMYESLEGSGLSEEERLSISEDSARISAGIESLGALFGIAGMGARAATKVGASLTKGGRKWFAKKVAAETAKKEFVKELAKKGIGEKLKDPKYIAYIGKKTAEHVLSAGAEGLQEVTQELVKDSFLKAIQDAENPENKPTIDNILSALDDGSESGKYGALFLNTALASIFLSGTGATATAGAKTGYQKMVANSLQKMNVDQVGDKIIEQKSNSKAYQKSPKAYSENTRAIIDAGNAPETATISTNKLLEIREQAEKEGDTTLLQKLEALGVTKERLEKDTTLTGQTTLDFQKFDEIVLDPKNPELYQKIRGSWSTDDTTLTGKEIQTLINDMVTKRPELELAARDPNSVFNIVLEGLQKNKNFTPKMALANAQLAQMATNRAMTFEGGTDTDARKIALSVINTKQSLLDKAKNIFDEVKTKVVEAKSSKQVESIAGEYASMLGQQVSDFHKRFATAILQKDFVYLSELLLAGRGMNENSKKMFEKVTGKKLPKTIKEREQFLVEWAGHDAEYTGETININGVERPTKNSEGNPIANSEKSLRAFYNWFGDSKVVDDQGRPLVVYHGSPKKGLDKLKNGYIYTTDAFDVAKTYSGDKGEVYKVYLKSENSSVIDAKGNYFSRIFGNKKTDVVVYEEIQKNKDIDGVIIKNVLDYGPRLTETKKTLIPATDYIVFNSTQVKRVENVGTFGINEDRMLYSKTQGEQIAGVFSKEMGEYIIKLTESANPTTFMHEFNHLVVTDMIETFNGGKMTPYWQKQTMKIADFVGAKPINGKLTFTEKQFEKVAEAFTTYLKEGRPPVEGLRDVFNRMAEWFIDVYRKLVMAKIPLNKSIRSAFDALLVSQEEIDKAIIDKNLRAIGRRDWITEDEYQGYISDLSALNRIATNKHIEAIRKQMRVAIQEKNKAKMEEIRKEIDAQVNARPEYVFEAAVLSMKINEGSVPSGYSIKNKEYVSKEGGFPAEKFITDFPDTVSNIGDIVGLLNNLEDKQTVIDNETQEAFNEWLKKEYEGKDEFIESDAKLTLANENLIKVRIKEYMMLKKIPLSQYEQYREELRRVSFEERNNMKVKDLSNLDKWKELEVKIVTKARFAKSDSELANLLWHQAAVNQIMILAKDAKKKVYSFNKHFNKYKYLPNKESLKTIDAYDFDLITAVLRNIGFTKKKPRIRDIAVSHRLEQWIDSKTAKTFSSAEEIRPYIPELSQETKVKFNNQTFRSFAIFDASVRLIEAVSKSDKVETETAGRELREEVAKEIIAFQEEKGIKEVSNWWSDLTMIPEQLLKKIWPTRVFNEYVLPWMDSHAKREQRISNLDKKIYDALKNTIKNKKMAFVIDLGGQKTVSLTYEELQVAVLNIDNMETWVSSWNKGKPEEKQLTIDDFLQIVDNAPEQMITDAKTIWSIFDSQKQEFRDAQYKIDGFLMDYVEPREVTLPSGRTIQSGYFPRGKKPVGKTGFTEMITPMAINGVYTFGTDRYAKDRYSQSHDELDLTISSIRSWAYHTATVIELGPAYNKLQKLFDNEQIKARMGEKASEFFNSWMKYSVVGDSVNKFLSSVDTISSVQILGWAPIKFVVQSLGWVGSLNETGIQWVAPQLLNPRNLIDGLNVFKTPDAAKLSPYMRERYENSLNHLASISDPSYLRNTKNAASVLAKAIMTFVVHGDAFASNVVWKGTYNKAISQGKSSEQAILIADSAVRRTQGDSIAVSRAILMRGDKRFFTKFASYFVSVNSRISSSIIGKDYWNAIGVAMLTGILAPVLESLLRSMWEWETGDDEDKRKWRKNDVRSFEDLVYSNMKNNVATTIGSSAIPVAGIGNYAANVLATGTAYDKPLPMIDYIGSWIKATMLPVRAAISDNRRDKERYLKEAKKSATKALTLPNNFIKIIEKIGD